VYCYLLILFIIMDSDLYGILGLATDATTEQIRKAYKKKALLTHPDRLPPGASATDKAAAEEQFRKVNNAYEVLSDPQNRRIYDLRDDWPPPDAHEEQPSSHRYGNSRRHQSPGRPHQQSYDFNDNFMFNSFSPFGRGFSYTDPFTLFDSIFGNLNRFTEPPFHHHRHHDDPRSHRQREPFFAEPERHFEGADDFMDAAARGGFPRRRAHTHMFPVMPNAVGPPPTILFQRAESRTYPQNGHWTQESRVTSTVNGVTQSIWKRRDADGNEHITRTYPDGREIYTINGVEQMQPLPGSGSRVDRYIPPQNYSGGQHGHHHVVQPPIINQQSGGRQEYAPAGPPPSYSSRGYNRNPNNSPVYPERSHRRDRTQSDTKRWWRGS